MEGEWQRRRGDADEEQERADETGRVRSRNVKEKENRETRQEKERKE